MVNDSFRSSITESRFVRPFSFDLQSALSRSALIRLSFWRFYFWQMETSKGEGGLPPSSSSSSSSTSSFVETCKWNRLLEVFESQREISITRKWPCWRDGTVKTQGRERQGRDGQFLIKKQIEMPVPGLGPAINFAERAANQRTGSPPNRFIRNAASVKIFNGFITQWAPTQLS